MYAVIDAKGLVISYHDQPVTVSEHKGYSCLPVVDAQPDRKPDPGETAADSPKITIYADALTRTWYIRPKTAGELLAECHAARLAAYPTIGDQLDAAHKARMGDPHPQAAIDAAIAAVKAAHPKPAPPDTA